MAPQAAAGSRPRPRSARAPVTAPLSVVVAIDHDTSEDAVRCLAAAFQSDPADVRRDLGPNLLTVPSFTVLVGYRSGEPVATSMLATTPSVRPAGVYSVATRPASQRRGFGTAITAAALPVARAGGYDTAVREPSTVGPPMYRRMGFGPFAPYLVGVVPADLARSGWCTTPSGRAGPGSSRNPVTARAGGLTSSDPPDIGSRGRPEGAGGAGRRGCANKGQNMRRRFLALLTSATVVATSLVTLAAPAGAVAEHLVTVGDFFFNPATISIKAGDTVNFRFVGPEPHSATSTDGAFDTGIHIDGVEAVSFPEPGTYDYFCVLHSDMQGSVRVSGATAERVPAASHPIDQALRWSQGNPAGSAPIVLLGRADVFADSLASGGLQGHFGAPLLLTQTEALNSGTAAEMERLGAKRVIILGGTNAVSSRVADQLRAKGYGVDRVAGSTRIGTATALASRYLPSADTAILARAFASGSDPTRAFADSLAAGALSAETGWPVLLSETERLSAETEAYLTRSAVSRVIVAGGTAAISQAVEDRLTELGIEVTRAAGDDRTGTAFALAMEAPFEHGAGGVILVESTSADSWVSGLAAALSASRMDAVVLPSSAVGTGGLWQILIDDRPQVVCGPGVDATACDRAAIAATSSTFEDAASRFAILTGDFEPNGGNAEAMNGGALLHRTSDPGAVCYDAFVFLESTAAHIHRLSDKSAVIDLALLPGLFGDPYGCTFGLDAALVRHVFENPEEYYINVHSEAFPKGEIAGELFQPDFQYFAAAFGKNETPPVDQPGGAFVILLGDDDRVCTVMFAEGLSGPATASHIHEGEEGVAGPPVVTLPAPVEMGPGFSLGIGCGEATTELVTDIHQNPSAYYVNIHTDAHPKGEFRGQVRPMAFTADGTHTATREASSLRTATGMGS